jgi:hypothetical protein
MAAATKMRRSQSHQGRYARASGHRTQGLRRRRRPKPTGVQKVLRSMVPAGAAKKAAPNSKKGRAGGLAVLAAAAGMAFKNRDKLKRPDRGGDVAPPSTPAV